MRSLTYPVLKKIPTESNVFYLSGENAEGAIKNSIEKSDSRGPGLKLLAFSLAADETGFSTVVKTSKNYSLAQKSIACARLG
ncbi:hypothetical protein HAP90_17565 [Klebsiella quasipneumoniae subsp. similipneumoniae]|uniref:hypothetical protein n=1 Tax=Klebsiella quasipneumoniae TaxID=1463165 RepID=UPI00111324F7|nr:hypothetical protein [Klebsiella quasipneumoniae]NHJ29117.1 hypothetical protein [Klebsiella quasipneumoniae subsp. similipneumoniae]NHJ53420.1 hypothetical protein [Klebsiella quasipneumoniae subsp. similipneumoniae]NHJ66971.1 hypothetical protein [Klebsiella quasipneumoniae subsp. similipneumoniae]NHJ71915.1 hypothetical protein [Klebsiella quasipneumoniae subsp. similipneumoniae]NHJ82259.1 hypothetical protein [Klebsiella quasipneumoniae subsp. similipneumoniae]